MPDRPRRPGSGVWPGGGDDVRPGGGGDVRLGAGWRCLAGRWGDVWPGGGVVMCGRWLESDVWPAAGGYAAGHTCSAAVPPQFRRGSAAVPPQFRRSSAAVPPRFRRGRAARGGVYLPAFSVRLALRKAEGEQLYFLTKLRKKTDPSTNPVRC